MATQSVRTKRKSKWDQRAPNVNDKANLTTENKADDNPPSTVNEEDKAAVAKAAAARLNAILAAKGKIIKSEPPPALAKPTTTSSVTNTSTSSTSDNNGSNQASKSSQPAVITAEIEINDLISRTILCKGLTQDDINRQSGAAVSTKGRYISPSEKLGIDLTVDRPLYLHIQAAAKENIHTAARIILAKIAKIDPATKPEVKYTPADAAPSSTNVTTTTVPLPTGLHYVQDKVFVGLNDAPAQFNLKEKLQGSNGSFFLHIIKETGAKVQLRGKGSGYIEPTSGKEAFEPLHIYVNHGTYEGLESAKKLCQNLVDTVKQQYKQFEESQAKAQVPITYQSPYPTPNTNYFASGYPPPSPVPYQNMYGYPMYGQQQVPPALPPHMVSPNPYASPYGQFANYGQSNQYQGNMYNNYYGYPMATYTQNEIPQVSPSTTVNQEEPPAKKLKNEEPNSSSIAEDSSELPQDIEKMPNLPDYTNTLNAIGKDEISQKVGNKAIDVPDPFGLLGTGKSNSKPKSSRQNTETSAMKDRDLMPPPAFLPVSNPIAPGNTKIQASNGFKSTTKQKNSTGESSKSGLLSLASYGSDSDEESSDSASAPDGNRLPFWAAHDYKKATE
ncbi:uncharacterized protein TRIADDRAFT_54683 [Trichoplax adhaerens]|uniref:KH homology domain-containing protein 4 n=1 Tax=Trichoplax adhaerens TaxID=10228 RepID=B3RSP9_TRIAD|nr:hypothetical protein TRIADDRAFT_54683 [Trichoplax adhaerens]EDV27091.1 hypothetical protein TRIADDRAFT_54683 [Trichoplax adhaerens]|eukprot:XP_002111087.1 hypothetical protein TRIADDRAFT_54683 [Trichoplax adhaerens]